MCAHARGYPGASAFGCAVQHGPGSAAPRWAPGWARRHITPAWAVQVSCARAPFNLIWPAACVCASAFSYAVQPVTPAACIPIGCAQAGPAAHVGGCRDWRLIHHYNYIRSLSSIVATPIFSAASFITLSKLGSTIRRRFLVPGGLVSSCDSSIF